MISTDIFAVLPVIPVGIMETLLTAIAVSVLQLNGIHLTVLYQQQHYWCAILYNHPNNAHQYYSKRHA
jgi:hypothetical protein